MAKKAQSQDPEKPAESASAAPDAPTTAAESPVGQEGQASESLPATGATTPIETKTPEVDVEEQQPDNVVFARVSEDMVVFATKEGASNTLAKAARFTSAEAEKVAKSMRKSHPGAEVGSFAKLSERFN